jgi:hypothetical protein
VTSFGDWTPKDSFAPRSQPDPRYVAQRIHELRQFLAGLVGNQIADWTDLTRDEQDIAVALGVQLTVHLLAKGRDGSALALHEARRFLRDEPEWRELTPQEAAVALAMVDDVVRWLILEGTEIA